MHCDVIDLCMQAEQVSSKTGVTSTSHQLGTNLLTGEAPVSFDMSVWLVLLNSSLKDDYACLSAPQLNYL
jgi:hypothetical protein